MKRVSILASSAFLLLAANALFAASPCQTPTGGSSWTGFGVSSTYSGDGGGCNVTITFGAGGAISTATTNAAGFYDDGGDDNLVGIVNNSGSTIFSVALTSSTEEIMNFDGDGICSGYTFAVAQNTVCSAASELSGNEANYAPIGVSFSNISSSGGLTDNNGTVNFAAGIASGATAFFSLEDPVDLSHLGVTTAPEPTSVLLFATILLSAVWVIRRRQVKS